MGIRCRISTISAFLAIKMARAAFFRSISNPLCTPKKVATLKRNSPIPKMRLLSAGTLGLLGWKSELLWPVLSCLAWPSAIFHLPDKNTQLLKSAFILTQLPWS